MNFLRKIFSFSIFFLFFISFAHAQQWEHLGLVGETIETIAIDKTNPNIIYAGSTSNFSTGKVGSLFKSSNKGISWDTLYRNITVRDIDFHPTNSNIVFVTGGSNGLTPSRIIKTSNGGQTWIKADSGVLKTGYTGPFVLEFDLFCPETLYMGTGFLDGGALYKSSNGGVFWTKINGPSAFLDGITALCVNPKKTNNIFVGVNGSGKLFCSTNNGSDWIDRGQIGGLIDAIRFNKYGKMYVGTSATDGFPVGLFFSNDSSITWNYFNPGFLSQTHIRKMIITGDTIYVRGSDDLYRIINDSILLKISIDGNKCREIAVSGNDIYIGTENGIIKSDIVTTAKNKNVQYPHTTMLFQNFPNPFNPTTEIVYEISKPSAVILEIFNSIGQLIDRFVKNHSEAGKYSFVWNASTKPSGVYFVRMQAGGYSSAKKMVLMK